MQYDIILGTTVIICYLSSTLSMAAANARGRRMPAAVDECAWRRPPAKAAPYQTPPVAERVVITDR
jgi:hypothetical protein